MKDTALKALTPLQERFCEEYICDLNAFHAAIRAGYKDGNKGRQLVTLSNVSIRIAELMQARAERTEITQDRVLEELAAVGFTKFTQLAAWSEEHLMFVPSADLDEMAQRSVKSVKVKRTTQTRKGQRGEPDEVTLTVETELTQHDKLSALDKLAKHLNLYGEHGEDKKRSGLDDLIESMAVLRMKRSEGA